MQLSSALNIHRKQLSRIVATLFAMIGLVDAGSVERLSLPVYRSVLRVLRPAESAVRRLIIVAARSITLKPPVARGALPAVPRKARKTQRPATFRLFDPRRRFRSALDHQPGRHRIELVRRPEPRLRVIDVSFDPRVPLFRMPPPAVPKPAPVLVADGTVNAVRLSRRLAALKAALDDLPRQARRYLRWQAKPHDARRPKLATALRPGPPPGHRKNPIHKVDEILAECDWLAKHAARADTS